MGVWKGMYMRHLPTNSLCNVLDAKILISESFVSENGSPVLNLSNHCAYMYDVSLCSW